MEDNFLLESIAACPGKQSALTMYFTVNTAFMHYFDSLTENLDIHISENWTTQEQVFLISLQTFEFDSKLLKVPKTLKDLVYQYKQRGQIIIGKVNNKNIKDSFLDNIIMDVFLFIATILSMIATAVFIHLVCRHAKLKALLTGIAFQPVKQTEAIFGNGKEEQICAMHWYTIAALTLMVILLTIYILDTTQKCTIFKRTLYSNTVTVMLFSDIKQYVPVKLCKTAESIHLFQIYGQLTPGQITIERKYLWGIIRMDWREVFVTLNGRIIHLPISVKIPLRDKYRLRCIMRKRSLLLHVMLGQ